MCCAKTCTASDRVLYARLLRIHPALKVYRSDGAGEREGGRGPGAEGLGAMAVPVWLVMHALIMSWLVSATSSLARRCPLHPLFAPRLGTQRAHLRANA